ncbi:hypothetical protein [Aliikangiella maris]|uniref:Uncharacterized protein n=2 Tax=Aliikangiella maris TaxID=3162458 RepID=A0ABV2BRV2_9GAMM
MITLQNQSQLWTQPLTSDEQTQYIELAYVISGECHIEYENSLEDKTNHVKNKLEKLSAGQTLVNKVNRLKSVQSFASKTKIFVAQIFIW